MAGEGKKGWFFWFVMLLLVGGGFFGYRRYKEKQKEDMAVKIMETLAILQGVDPEALKASKADPEVRAIAALAAGYAIQAEKTDKMYEGMYKDLSVKSRRNEKYALTQKLFSLGGSKTPVTYRDYLALGFICYEDEEYEKARILFEASKNMNPKDPEPWLFLSLASEKCGMKKEAEQAKEKALELDLAMKGIQYRPLKKSAAVEPVRP